MSSSAFHRQFKALTSMRPLQYQKQLGLLEARRLMLTDSANVETAAFGLAMKALRNPAVNIPECLGFPRGAIYKLSGVPLREN
jgi:methylphosphotriester-DNA--protein-cysteine methyltransferase